MWGPDGVRCTTGTPRQTYAEAAGKGEPRVDVAAVLEAFRQEIKAEIKKNMLEVVEQARSAQAAASPAVAAAPRGGGASAQDLEAQFQQLQQKVKELEAAYGRVQQQYFESFIRTFLFLRKATCSAECCLFRRFCKISAVFRFWRPVLNTWPHRFERIFGKGHAASTIFWSEYAARGFGRIAATASKSQRHGGYDTAGARNGRREAEESPCRRCRAPRSPCVDNR